MAEALFVGPAPDARSPEVCRAVAIARTADSVAPSLSLLADCKEWEVRPFGYQLAGARHFRVESLPVDS